MFWNFLLKLFAVTGITDVTVWQDIFLSALFIPLSILLFKAIIDWWVASRPVKKLLKGYLGGGEVLVFLSQLSAADGDNLAVNTDQKYLIKYPHPLPNKKDAIAVEQRYKIDPLWSEADGKCLADIYNVLGEAGKVSGIKVASLVEDWDVWDKPIITIGFNPKTNQLFRENCGPIYFDFAPNGLALKITGGTKVIDCWVPNDGGVIQKTYVKDLDIPVIILAGLGTAGTAAAGYFFRKNALDLGRLYDNRPFCVLLKVRIDQGEGSTVAVEIYPKPKTPNMILHPLTYLKFSKIFPRPNTA